MTGSWGSYPKIWNLGHKAVTDILKEPVLVEEKVDGSQFSFCRVGDELLVRSKGAVMIPDAPERMFTKAVETAKNLLPMLKEGWTYRGEYLLRPKHNALAYDRVPAQHVILFDVCTGPETYLSYPEKAEEAHRLGLEVVPLLYQGHIGTLEAFRAFLDRTSVLGGQKVEGVVVKNYNRFTVDGKAMFGKFVSESFKEVHGASWKESNPHANDVLAFIIEKLKTPARWNKAIQHLRERGQIEDSPRDIGKLVREVQGDTKAECMGEITGALLSWALPKIERGIVGGLAEWYKEELLKKQFEVLAA